MDEARLLRFPAINGDQIVFSYAGDLYSVVAGGGIARKLTTDTGYEIFPRFSPDGTHLGPKVALCDKYSASDGDLFSYRFKYNKLGTLIGTRTWGGVVGISGPAPTIDGGNINTPSWAPYAADGSSFIIEGYGVEPDIVVENDPHNEYLGQDDQLDKAISVALEKLKTEGRQLPAIPPFPDKSGKK